MSDAQDWDEWLDQIAERGVNLTAWEIDFVEDMQGKRAAKRTLTDKQVEILERIFAQRTP